MSHLREFLFVLVAVATMFTTVASAQMYSCNGSAVPTLVRSEGIAELPAVGNPMEDTVSQKEDLPCQP